MIEQFRRRLRFIECPAGSLHANRLQKDSLQQGGGRAIQEVGLARSSMVEDAVLTPVGPHELAPRRCSPSDRRSIQSRQMFVMLKVVALAKLIIAVAETSAPFLTVTGLQPPGPSL